MFNKDVQSDKETLIGQILPADVHRRIEYEMSETSGEGINPLFSETNCTLTSNFTEIT
jgi:hypothetical protein